MSIFPIQIVDFKDDVEDDEEEVDEDEAIFSSATRVGLNQHKFTRKIYFSNVFNGVGSTIKRKRVITYLITRSGRRGS